MNRAACKALGLALALGAAACGGGQQFNPDLDPAVLVGPVDIKVLPGDQYALVNSSNFNLSQGSGALLVVDLANRKIIPQATIALPNFTRQFDFNTALNRLYLTSSAEDSLLLFAMKIPGDGGLPVSFQQIELTDPDQQRYSGGARIGKNVSSYGCRYLDRGAGLAARVYITNIDAGDISIFDVASSQILDMNPKNSDRTGIQLQSVETLTSANIPLGIGANRSYLDPLSQLLLVVSSRGDNIFMFDPRSESVQSVLEVRQTNVSGGTRALVISATREIWASHAGLGGVMVLDGSEVAANGQLGQLQTARWLDFVATGKSPEDVILNPAGDKLYVANFGEKTVSVIDLDRRQVLKQIEVGVAPLQFAISAARNELYVLNFVGGNVAVIDLATDQVVATIP